ncbi:hypothetical protein DI487_08115 [Flavobacterium sediminis]|uniref:tRNA (Guanine-N1)-methyltransferase n=1 Tax=Flavobacterium sediminis TaxID=2201181 RepID=A0A2U8QUF0_9FLAO|nr:hypothetical protein [Flavobacterium sediminis]AWM13832.1 hypothetical protein DI487_08115 [Flavobacterium sediminis]
MKKFSYALIFVVTICLSPKVAFSGEIKGNIFTEHTQAQAKLESQIHTVLDQSLNYKDYKVIDKQVMSRFKSELESFLNLSDQVRSDFQKEIKTKDSEISALDESLKSLQVETSKLRNDKQSIGFLGMSINKYVYVSSLWALFFASLLVIGFFVLKFMRANEITKSSKTILSNLEDEYEAFRRSSIEREQKLRRELFNEMKKVKELKQAS